MLEMKTACERCQTALPQDSEATICSFECTFCLPCSEQMTHICPNCQGELLPRPKRLVKPINETEVLS